MLRSGVEYVVNVFTNFSVISRHEHRHYESETVNNEIVHNKFKGLNYFHIRILSILCMPV